MAPRVVLCLLLAAALCVGWSQAQGRAPTQLTDGFQELGTVTESDVIEYRFRINGAQFRANPFDAHITLDVLAGDCDLVVKGPRRFLVYSEHPAGEDVLYISREQFQAVCGTTETCDFRVLVVGYSPVAEYSLEFDIEGTQRVLATEDQQVLEEIYQECCRAPNACVAWENAVRSSNVGGQLENFCHLQNQICDAEGHVTHLNLADSGLQCNLPEALARLPSLQRLFVFDNQITGTFAEFMVLASRLPNLVHVHASQNQMSGEVVCCPGDAPDCLHHLRTLDMRQNAFTGSLPVCLLELPTLGMLDLSNNRLSGAFPAPVANEHMFVLDVRDQEGEGMSGQLPDFTPLNNLALLGLSFNSFSGSFPAIPSKLEALHIGNNDITGPFDASVENLDKIWIFDADNNRITGAFPEVLSTSKTLKVVEVHDNELSGELPQQWDTTALRVLDVSGNQLSGLFPAGVGALQRLTIFNATGNALTGTLDAFADSLDFNNDLRQLSLSHNQISGSLPQAISRLAAFSLFTGATGFQIPQIFDASFNNLSGAFPKFLLEDILVLNDSGLYDFSFTIQGNYINCPADSAQDILTNLPDLEDTSCRNTDGDITTVSGKPVPEAVRQAMAAALKDQPSIERQPVQGSSGVTDPSVESPLLPGPGGSGNPGSSVELQQQQPSTQNAQDGSGALPQAAIIGIAVAAGVVALALVALLGVFVIKPFMAKRSQEKYQSYEGEAATDPTTTSAPMYTADMPSDTNAASGIEMA